MDNFGPCFGPGIRLTHDIHDDERIDAAPLGEPSRKPSLHWVAQGTVRRERAPNLLMAPGMNCQFVAAFERQSILFGAKT
jgi:hypothetical protein